MMTRLAAWIAEQLQVALVLRAVLALLPLVALSFYSGNTLWLQAAVVTMSALIVEERVKLAPLGVALHGLLIIACFTLLFLALRVPWLFVISTAALAAGTIRIAGYGKKLRSLGNFTFIPALYLACEVAESSAGKPAGDTLLTVLPYQFVVLLPALVIAAMHHLREPASRPNRRWLHHLRLKRSSDLGGQMPYGEAMLAITLAVALASLFVMITHIHFGQWVIWSAASVVTGEVSSARNKLRDRSLGAAVGVPAGLLIGAFLPHNAFCYALASLGTMLTLVAFRGYILGFGARCACIAIALTVAGQSPAIATERVFNVIIGGLISIVCTIVLRRYAAKGGAALK